MPSFTIKSLLIGAGAVSVLAAPASISRRDAATISQDIKYVNGNLTAMTEVTQQWSGGLIQALPLTKAEGNLEQSIKEAAIGAQASEQLNSENTKAIIAYINGQLEPNIGKVLGALSGKKEQFTKVKLANKVASDVATLKQLTDSLAVTLIEKASGDQKEAGKQALAKIDADFATATQTWPAKQETSSASRMVRRDAVTIFADIKGVNGNLTELAQITDSWNGALLAAIPITKSESNLEQAIKVASLGAQASEQVDSQNTKEIISFINSTLEPNINKVLSSLSAKKEQFAKVKLTKVVAQDVATLQQLYSELAATLIEKASADQKEAAKAAVSKIDADFAKATDTWPVEASTSAAASAN